MLYWLLLFTKHICDAVSPWIQYSFFFDLRRLNGSCCFWSVSSALHVFPVYSPNIDNKDPKILSAGSAHVRAALAPGIQSFSWVVNSSCWTEIYTECYYYYSMSLDMCPVGCVCVCVWIHMCKGWGMLLKWPSPDTQNMLSFPIAESWGFFF